MILLLALVGCIVIVAAARLALPPLRRWRMESALRGDWWTRFERDLRAYEREWRVAARQRRP